MLEAVTDSSSNFDDASHSDGEPALKDQPPQEFNWVKEIGFSFLRVPFLVAFMWILSLIFMVIPMLVSPLVDMIPNDSIRIPVLLTIVYIATIGAGIFLGYHYRHWNVFFAAAIICIPLMPFGGPVNGIGMLIGYVLAPKIFRKRFAT